MHQNTGILVARGAALALCSIALALMTAPGPSMGAARGSGDVDDARPGADDSGSRNWLTGGRDEDGSYFSPLKSIDANNVKHLGFAWQYDLGDPRRGQQATPIVIDGVMYTSGTWGYVLESMPQPAASGGGMTRNRTISRAGTRVAIWSIEGWRCGRGRSSSPRPMGACMPWMRGPALKFGKPIPSPTTRCRMPAPAHHRSQVRWWSSATRARTWDAVRCAAMSVPTTWTPARSNGASTPCRAPSASRSRIPSWPRRKDLGPASRGAVPGWRYGLGWLRL